MDFVDGLDLQARLHQGPLPLGEVVRILKEIARAVDYATVKESSIAIQNQVMCCSIKMVMCR
jgi:hypothetical protein